jgi:hypothetical protein
LCDRARLVPQQLAGEYPLLITELDLQEQPGYELMVLAAGMHRPPAVLLNDAPFSAGRLSERKLRQLCADSPQQAGDLA